MTRLLRTLKGTGYFGSLVATFDFLAWLERRQARNLARHIARHPAPPGRQQGATWVAKHDKGDA